MTITTGDWHAAWTAALDALELDVARAEQLLAVRRPDPDEELLLVGPGWAPPALAGPLPVALKGRAEAILARQLRAAEELATAMRVNRREHRLAARIGSGGRDRAVPVFHDSSY